MPWRTAARPLLVRYQHLLSTSLSITTCKALPCTTSLHEKQFQSNSYFRLYKQSISTATIQQKEHSSDPAQTSSHGSSRPSSHKSQVTEQILRANGDPSQAAGSDRWANPFPPGAGIEGQAFCPAAEDDVSKCQVARREWSTVPRPVAEAVLRRYGGTLAVAKQVLILHGPRGVGKRTTVEGVVQEWLQPPHFAAYVNLEAPAPTVAEQGLQSPWLPLDWHIRLSPSGGDEEGSCNPEGRDSGFRARRRAAQAADGQGTAEDTQGETDRENSTVSGQRGEEETAGFRKGSGRGGQETGAGASRESVYELGLVRERLEGALESLAVLAVGRKCLEAQDVFFRIFETHGFEGALVHLLTAKGVDVRAAEKVEGPRRQLELWKLGLVSVAKEGALQPEGLGLGKDWYGELVRSEAGTKPTGKVNVYVPAVGTKAGRELPEAEKTKARQRGRWRRPVADSRLLQAGAREAVLSLALAKEVLALQERWRARGKEGRGREGVWKGAAEAAAAWATLLVDLISGAAKHGVFQPKLIINGMDVMRKAVSPPAGTLSAIDGAAFHDAFLLRLLRCSVTATCLPTILVSSDSYYSEQVYLDFGTRQTFESFEMFGWSVEEAAIYLVPHVFDDLQWKVVAGVVGGSPRHLAEVHSVWEAHQRTAGDVGRISAIDNCLDDYLGFLLLTVVDPAMDVAQTLVEDFAVKAASGKLPPDATPWGMAWRSFPQKGRFLAEGRASWARRQLVDFLEALASAEFGLNHGGEPALELQMDPAAQALIRVGLLYQQKDPSYLRPPSRAFQRCLARWLIREKLQWTPADRVKYMWHRVMRGRSYRHLVKA